MSEPDLLDAARAIRPYLPSLLDESAAAEVDSSLAALLASGGTEDAVLAELEGHEATAEWTAAFLEHGAPPELAVVRERDFTELAGHGEPVRAPKYICPEGDFVWYRHAVGQQPPRCPTHGKVVEPVPA